MAILSIAIQKGGSGKTTTAVNLAAALRDLKKKVLLLDLDPQSNLTQAMGVEGYPEKNVYALLKTEANGQEADIGEAIISCNDIDFIPAHLDLAFAELELVSVYGREKLLFDMLGRIKNRYDHIILDCPPAVGMLTVNAMVASDCVIIPMQAEFLPKRGVESFMRFFEKMKKLNPALKILGILLTRFDSRIGMSRQVEEAITKEHGPLLFSSKIRVNNALSKAQEQGKDIFTYDPDTTGALNYMSFAYEVLNRLGQTI